MNTFEVIGDLSFATVTVQRDHFIKFINAAADNQIAVNLAAVKHSDSAGVALLIEILRIATRLHKTVTFQQLPAQMTSVVKFCNLSKIIEPSNGT